MTVLVTIIATLSLLLAALERKLRERHTAPRASGPDRGGRGGRDAIVDHTGHEPGKLVSASDSRRPGRRPS
jgi:hypothetical protein